MESSKTKTNKTNRILEALDVNKNGQVDIEEIIVLSMKTPGVKIDRELFLRKEFRNLCDTNVLENAIKLTPKTAGISEEIIEKVADEVVKYERNCVSGISSFLSLPGGLALIATVPADIIQYYGFLLRAA